MHSIIGDIHGLESWKELVREESVNVFVGDYFDSKDGRSVEQVVRNFEDIIAFKRKRPETILLYGNHDLNYLLDLDYRSKFSLRQQRERYRQLLDGHADLFYGVAYAIDEKTLVSHAGVTKEWYERYIGPYNGENACVVAEQVNALWRMDKKAFTFSSNVSISPDIWGESPGHSPVWIRSWVLPAHNLFAANDIVQIIGHTPQNDITTISERIICVDCLHKTKKQLVIEENKIAK